MALSRDGHVYAWGEATVGQLGLDDTRDLPKNTEGKSYQPYPTRVEALSNKKIVAISCGETHTLALTDNGHLYSFGSNICGQLGQYVSEYERKRRDSYEEINLQKISNSLDRSYSFMSGFESSNNSVQSSPRGDSNEMGQPQRNQEADQN
jgi:alpha-tubulin suppressor-like RCC1 family protein